MPRLHDGRSEIASSERMAISISVELECMIYSKLSDRYNGFFFGTSGFEIQLAVVASVTMNGGIYYRC